VANLTLVKMLEGGTKIGASTDEFDDEGEAPSVLFKRVMTERLMPVYANVRPWQTFFVLVKPESYVKARSAMQENLYYFRMNYIVLLSLIMLIGILFHPSSIIGCIIAAALWGRLIWAEQNPSFRVEIAGREIKPPQRYAIVAALSLVIMYLVAGLLIFNLFGFGAIVIGIHGILHPGSSAVDAYEQVGFDVI